jgi:hypothetical protein
MLRMMKDFAAAVNTFASATKNIGKRNENNALSAHDAQETITSDAIGTTC